MKKEIENYLIDHFDGRGNDYHETIESFEINDNQVIIETWISFEVETDSIGDIFMTDYVRRETLKRELVEKGTFALLRVNYVCGFYCEFFESITPEEFMQDADIESNPELSFARLHLPMAYTMDLSKIEIMYHGYKNCA